MLIGLVVLALLADMALSTYRSVPHGNARWYFFLIAIVINIIIIILFVIKIIVIFTVIVIILYLFNIIIITTLG